MRHTALFLLLAFALSAHSQTNTFYGQLLDAETEEPIPFAHFEVLNESGHTGFVSDFEGQFSYNSDKSQLEIRVSAIGYQSRTFTIKPNQKASIELNGDVGTFSEVVILSVDYERELLKKVLKNIPNNYPTSNERIVGQMKEQLAKDSLYKQPYYTADVTTEADKFSYKHKTPFGPVKIIDGETIYHDTLDFPFKIIAGVHNIHRFDILAGRMEPFNNIDNKRYHFRIKDTLQYEGKPLIRMFFSCKRYMGHLYIQDSTFALIKGEYTAKEEALGSFGSSSDRLFLHFTSEYYKQDSLYRLSYINYRSAFADNWEMGRDSIYLNNFYYIKDYSNSEKRISYNEEVNYGDALIHEVPAFMEGSDDTIHLNGTTDIAAAAKLEALKTNKLAKQVKKLSTGLGVGILQYHSNIEGLTISELSVNSVFQTLTKPYLFTDIGYEFNNRLGLFLHAGRSLDRRTFRTYAMYLKWNQPLSVKRRWEMGLSGGVNWMNMTVRREEIQSNSAVLINGVSFESGDIQVQERVKQWNLQGSLHLKYRVGSRFFLYGFSTLPFTFSNQVSINIKQDDNTVEYVRYEDLPNWEIPFYSWGLGLEVKM